MHGAAPARFTRVGASAPIRSPSSRVHPRAVACSRATQEVTMHALAALALAALPVHPGPAHFVRHVDNPWFPLRPGTTYIYRGTQEAEPVRDTVRVCAAPAGSRAFAAPRFATRCSCADGSRSGRPTTTRRTAAATSGTSASRRPSSDANGDVTSTEGTWRSGVHGARAGIVMPPHPRVGRTYRAGVPPRARRGPLHDHQPPRAHRDAVRDHEQRASDEGVHAARAGDLRREALRHGIGNVAEQSLTGPKEALQLDEVLAPS